MFREADPAFQPEHQKAGRGLRATYLFFAAVVWFIATFAFLGDLGQWSDDFAYFRRDYATDQNALTFGKSIVPFFWRPLYYMTLPWLQSELGGHWTNHLISASVIAGVAALLYAFLRRLGIWRAAAAAASISIFAFPATWELPLWLSAMPTGLSVATFLLLALLTFAWLSSPPAPWWKSSAMYIATFALALAIPCWNEQIAAAAPALFLIALGERNEAGRHPWGRAFMIATVSCAAQCTYLILYWSTCKGTNRGSVGSIVKPSEVIDQFSYVARGAREIACLHDFGGPALRAGFEAMAHGPFAASIGAVAVLLSAGCWLARITRTTHHDSTRSRPERTVAAIAFGIATFSLAWLPLLLIRGQGVESRLWFPPLVGLAIASAGAVHALMRTRLAAFAAARFVFGACTIACLVPALVMLVGIQSAMHDRHRLDARQATQLRQLVPNPAPWTVFVPLEVMMPRDHRWTRFAATFYGPWEHVPASTPSIRSIYRRKDLGMGWRKVSANRSPKLAATAEGLVYDDTMVDDWMRLYRQFHKGAPPPTTIPWTKAVPFVIDPHGNIVLVDQVIASAGGDDVRTFHSHIVRTLTQQRPTDAIFARVRLHPDHKMNRVTFHRNRPAPPSSVGQHP